VTTREQQLAANLRLVCAARPRTGDAVADADHQTTMADLRAAICLAAGVSPDEIGPLGHDHSARGYANVRQSWMRHVEQWGITMFDDTMSDVIAIWQKARPDLTAGDDWREAGAKTHQAAYPDGGCFYGDRCVICSPLPEEWA
jgi:hypothetical protein